MIYSRALVMVVVASCAGDVPTLNVETTALVPIDLVPPDDKIPTALGHYRWELTYGPDSPMVSRPSSTIETFDLPITPAVRGIYFYDRWFVGQAAEQLSYHVVVTVDGAVPVANIVGPTMGVIGQTATFDGRASSSPEHLILCFAWRLASRPESSSTYLDAVVTPMASFFPDVAGDYRIELRVFDGELWSEPAAITLTAR